MSAPAAHAQPVPETREYSRKGELSPGTEAPTAAAMLQAIEGGSPERLKTTLEYGERVHCPACVPLLERRMLESAAPRVRELSAWWLRRQPFAAPGVLARLRARLPVEGDAARRARIVEALGELMDPAAFALLAARAREDGDAGVRAATVRALARLNDPRAGAEISHALSDPSPEVKRSALDAVLGVSGFRDLAPLVVLLGDADARLRAQAATLCGEYRVTAAEAPLAAMLRGDQAASARKAAAWALGRIGTATARAVLDERTPLETDALVKSALAVAQRMPARAP
ncbi:MAG: HEAT repeat domain-containing protein [Polyangiales bacterium]